MHVFFPVPILLLSHFRIQMSFSLPPTTSPSHHPTPPQAKLRKPPPLFISTNPSDLDLLHLRDLLHSSNLSCHRFPNLTPNGHVEPVDIEKLRTAILNSSIVVSAFCRSKHLVAAPGEVSDGVSEFAFKQLFQRVASVPVAERRLVGFGRAVTDGALTASIHDVVVTPSLQRLGIGGKIIQKITRYLTSKDIYDISALCSEKEKLFFKACGFGGDYLGATTMMYTRSASMELDEKRIKRAGRKLLLVPSSQVTFKH